MNRPRSDSTITRAHHGREMGSLSPGTRPVILVAEVSPEVRALLTMQLEDAVPSLRQHDETLMTSARSGDRLSQGTQGP